MFAVDVCNLPETGGSTFVLIAGVFVLVAGVIVTRWVRQSAGRLSVVVAPLVLLGGFVLVPQVTDPCAPATTTVPSATTTVPSATTTTTSVVGAALTPTFGSTTATTDGFTVVITNYDSSYTWAGTATTGSVAISGTGLITVTGVAAGTSSTATITTTRTGYAGGSNTVTATSLVAMSMVTVGDVGNAADTTSYGAVSYYYQIGTYEVTGSQYTAFLNAVASIDTHGLYNAGMGTDSGASQISRSGTSGTYTYAVMNSTGQRPITYVSWFDSARFANWMSNGQPSGAQTSTTTENGAYNLNGATSGNAVVANTVNPNTLLAPTFRIPLENEWYKAASYSPNYSGTGVDDYWTWATQSDTAPGTTIGSSPNQASYDVYDAATDVGSFSGSGSFYGTFDQSGNVWEWNDLNGIAGSNRGIRGGMWEYNSADVSSSTRMDYEPDNEDNDVGFRVASPVTLTLGATGPGGGIVFYVHGNGTFACGETLNRNCTYLEVAPNTWNGGSADPRAAWGCSGTSITGADGTAIGTGRQNTTDIVNGCATSGIAARLANDLTLGGQSDWFLPSKDELNQMYINLHSASTPLGGFSTDYYWSSSEWTSSNSDFAGLFADGQNFDGGGQNGGTKTNLYRVRPVRAF